MAPASEQSIVARGPAWRACNGCYYQPALNFHWNVFLLPSVDDHAPLNPMSREAIELFRQFTERQKEPQKPERKAEKPQ